ncbi:MAG: hypothetical protein HZC43_11995 [Nitrosomonadales bacterium]|nr:hypothetical protein [Nitrosomonadales bacterium]
MNLKPGRAGCGATKSGNLLSGKPDAELTLEGIASFAVDAVRRLTTSCGYALRSSSWGSIRAKKFPACFLNFARNTATSSCFTSPHPACRTTKANSSGFLKLRLRIGWQAASNR